MLFPPPGVKIRRTIETLFLPGTPTMIAEHDPRRVLLIVMVDTTNNATVCYAGTVAGLSTQVVVGNAYDFEFHFIGPEEVWAQCIVPSSPPGCNILVQSVFYD